MPQLEDVGTLAKAARLTIIPTVCADMPEAAKKGGRKPTEWKSPRSTIPRRPLLKQLRTRLRSAARSASRVGSRFNLGCGSAPWSQQNDRAASPTVTAIATRHQPNIGSREPEPDPYGKSPYQHAHCDRKGMYQNRSSTTVGRATMRNTAPAPEISRPATAKPNVGAKVSSRLPATMRPKPADGSPRAELRDNPADWQG